MKKNKIYNNHLKYIGSVSSIDQEFRYKTRNHLLTQSELKAYRYLLEIIGDQYTIFPQMHLGDIFEHKLQGQNWWRAFHHISQKSVDYLICENGTLQPLVAIEFDDWTHNLVKRFKRDDEVERIFNSSGLPLIRVKNISKLTLQSLKKAIEQ